jgi:hypothetical protein
MFNLIKKHQTTYSKGTTLTILTMINQRKLTKQELIEWLSAKEDEMH